MGRRNKGKKGHIVATERRLYQQSEPHAFREQIAAGQTPTLPGDLFDEDGMPVIAFDLIEMGVTVFYCGQQKFFLDMKTMKKVDVKLSDITDPDLLEHILEFERGKERDLYQDYGRQELDAALHRLKVAGREFYVPEHQGAAGGDRKPYTSHKNSIGTTVNGRYYGDNGRELFVEDAETGEPTMPRLEDFPPHVIQEGFQKMLESGVNLLDGMNLREDTPQHLRDDLRRAREKMEAAGLELEPPKNPPPRGKYQPKREEPSKPFRYRGPISDVD